MILNSVKFYIKTENIQGFIDATIENQNNSRKEAGNLHYNFFQSQDDPSIFFLYEIYKSQEAMEEHLKTEHFKKWLNTVEDMFSSPRERIRYIPVTPIQ